MPVAGPAEPSRTRHSRSRSREPSGASDVLSGALKHVREATDVRGDILNVRRRPAVNGGVIMDRAGGGEC